MFADNARMAPQPAPRDHLLDTFWERGLILIGERVEAEYALHTPIFIDLRHKLYDDLETLSQLGGALHQALISIVGKEPHSRARPQQVIGIPDTATPLALSAAMASRGTELPLIYGQMRKKPADYPGGQWGLSAYMGSKDPKREITLIDDVMASGRTKLWAMEQLERDGLTIKRVLVVVDREQGGEAILAGKGIPFYRLYRISELIDYYAATDRVDAASAEAAREHVRTHRFR
jgi:uridine monophosphate synthetase